MTIAGHKVKVVWGGTSPGTWGEFDPDTLKIHLHRSLRKKNRRLYRATLDHEIAHAVVHLTGLGHALFGGDEEKEEAFARMVELQLAPALRRG